MARGWRRGTEWRGRTEYAWTIRGAKRVLRRFNSRTGIDVFTANGRDYYTHNRQKFIINLPCKGYIAPSNTRHPDDADDDVLLRSSYYGHFQSTRIIPMTDDALSAYDSVTGHVRRLTGLGLVRDEDHPRETVEAALRRAVLAYIARAEKVQTVDGERTKIATESSLIWCFDPDGEITFDEEVVRHLHADENPMVEALLDRPLLGVPCSAERMYARMGLCSIASQDCTDRGGCMVAQIVETVKYMKKEGGQGTQAGGKDT
ncbi:MAG: hypothetical protein EBS51_12085, partial [Planctomycetia bacterium]|nr:hypothetical protein [Planctomycetia bacterium]